MTKPMVPPKRLAGRLKHWLLKYRVEDVPGPVAKEDRTERHPWWQVATAFVWVNAVCSALGTGAGFSHTRSLIMR